MKKHNDQQAEGIQHVVQDTCLANKGHSETFVHKHPTHVYFAELMCSECHQHIRWMSREDVAERETQHEGLPQFKHDSDCCVFLGRWRYTKAHEDPGWPSDYDLYFCDQGDILPVTVLARFGNDGPEYYSSLHIALYGNHPALKEAVRITMELLSGKNDLVRQWVKERHGT